MAITKRVKQHIHGWWPVQPSGSRVTGALLKQIVADLEEAGVDLGAELRVEQDSSSGWKVQGFRLSQENTIQ